jgi:hypothetical protein
MTNTATKATTPMPPVNNSANNQSATAAPGLKTAISGKHRIAAY